MHANQYQNLDASVKAAQSAPGYAQLSKEVNRLQLGDPSVEGPAWMTSGSQDNMRHFSGMDESMRSQFMRGYIKNLPQGQANIAQKLFQPPQTIPSSDNALNQNRF
jgi:hypothetical protein